MENTSCAGCMDESACDYDAGATIQATEESTMGSLSFSWPSLGSWPGEIAWGFAPVGEPFIYEGAAGDTFDYALEAGQYNISGSDSYGDGWNGGELIITDVNSGTSSVLLWRVMVDLLL